LGNSKGVKVRERGSSEQMYPSKMGIMINPSVRLEEKHGGLRNKT